MKTSIRKGVGFGLTSGIITTLGMITGLNSSTNSKAVVLAGIATIAIADSLSDSIAIHVSEEAERKHTTKEIWESTLSTLTSKIFFALTFVIPFVFLQLNTAVIVSVAWGLLVLTWFSAKIAEKGKSHVAVAEHLLIAIVVIALTHLVGKLIANFVL